VAGGVCTYIRTGKGERGNAMDGFSEIAEEGRIKIKQFTFHLSANVISRTLPVYAIRPTDPTTVN